VGGAERIVAALCAGLDRRYFVPILCTLRSAGRTAKRLHDDGIPVINLGLSPDTGPIDLLRTARRLAKVMDDVRPAIVHSFLYRANVATRIASRLVTRRPFVVSGHHSLSPPPSSHIQGSLAVLAERHTYRWSDRCAAVSRAVRDYLVNDLGVPARKVVILPNGIDTRSFARTNGCRPERFRAEVPPGRVVLGAAGRITKVKGFDVLIAALERLSHSGVDAHLLIAGDGPERPALVKLAGRHDLSDRISWLGMVSDVRSFYRALDLFVLSSRREASPTVLLEAMASGIPVVATRCGGSTEMIDDGRTGLLVESESSDAIASAIRYLASDSTLRKSLARAGQHAVQERFDVGTMTAQHERFYEQCLGRQNSIPCAAAR
jgi:Glycosyltransferase